MPSAPPRFAHRPVPCEGPLAPLALIANPAAQSGKGAGAIEEARAELERAFGAGSVAVFPTEGPRHATTIAEQLDERFATVVVLGGDGVVHEVANGLMRRAVRPHLAVIPMGSGNDFAATLGMAPSVRDAVAQIVQGREVSLDVGCVNGEHFVETLSFGLDAGIALGTNEWRQRTGWRGTPLYLASALDQLFHHFEKRSLHLELEDACALRYEAGVAMPTHQAIRVTGESYLFAIQLGPTYGGGFRIAPAALPDDGLFDLVIARPPLSIPVATGILLLAKGGHHTGFRSLEFYRARGVRVQVAAGTPIQVDGEALEGTEFDVSLLPGALCVLVGED